MTIELTETQYEVLLGWARMGAEQAGRDQFEAFHTVQKTVDLRHKIMRYTVLVKYLPKPNPVVLGETVAPKGEQVTITQTRPITREDVFMALEGKPYHPSMVWVTGDPYGEAGWYELEAFPWP